METILGTSYNAITVIGSDISPNGEHFTVSLKCYFGRLAVGSILSSNNGQQWQVVDNDLQLQSEDLQKRLHKLEEESIFIYDLKALGHLSGPSAGQVLTLVEPVS
jgi:hypothetical protein